MERGVNRTEIKTKQNGNGAVTPYDLPPIGQNTKREERERETFSHVYLHICPSPRSYIASPPPILPPLSLSDSPLSPSLLPSPAIVLSL
jgi:hypothetical protein